MKSILIKSGLRYFTKNPWQLVLSIIGVALGVAVVVSIDLANQSASRAFELSMESVAGKATHQISGGPSGLPDSMFAFVRSKLGIRNSAPVVEKFIKILGKNQRIMTLMGLDPFSEKPFRNYLTPEKLNYSQELVPMMFTDNAIVLSKSTARLLGVKAGDSLSIEINGNKKSLYIFGLINTENNYTGKILENLLITDIAIAQNILEMKGTISRIDLILKNPEEKIQIQTKLPEGINITQSNIRAVAGENMTESFRVNLTAMSFLALIVGMFLIYNTMTFSVVQRRNLIGLLRSLGVTRNEIFIQIISEAIIIGLVGTIAGLILGILLGNFLISLVTKTINDMYFVLQVQDIYISPGSLIKGLILGMSATILSAYIPASEAGLVPPRIAMTRSISESKLIKRIPLLIVFGIILIILGILILLIPSKNIYLSFIGVTPFLIGFALFTPAAVVGMVRIFTPIMQKLFGSIGKLASRGITEQLSRTTIAIAALSIAVACAMGIGTMVQSFRQTVVDWLNFRLKADIYCSVPTMVSRFNDGTFSPELADSLSKLPEIRAINRYREYQYNYNGKIYHILAAKVQSFNYETFKSKGKDMKEVWDLYIHKEGLVVSETFSYKNNCEVGDSIKIPTEKGVKNFYVAAIYHDYSSDIGLIMMDLNTYQKYFYDRKLSGLGLFVKKGYNIDSTVEKIRKYAGDLNLVVRSNRTLINSSIVIFDRTFLITNVLQLLAIVVSFIGILSALMALQLEKARELAVLRANGLTPVQLWKMVILQTGLIGLISGILATPLGNLLAFILIEVINKRSFGWTINFYFLPEYIVQGIVVSIFAAILAGIYPAYKMSVTPPALALRDE